MKIIQDQIQHVLFCTKVLYQTDVDFSLELHDYPFSNKYSN